jgi:death on curing protein
MMRYISVEEVEQLHQELVDQTGGLHGIRDHGLMESAVVQPLQQYAGIDLYPDVVAKAAALGFFLIKNHTFVDGNKRVGLASMQTVLLRNTFEIRTSDDELVDVILAVAAGEYSLEDFTSWLRKHIASKIGILKR